MKFSNTNLTLERLRECLEYNPETGEFTWLVTNSYRRVAGKTAGKFNRDGYRLICLDKQSYMAHRLAWFYMTGAWPVEEIDHKNCNRSDNSFINLREAKSSQNKGNARTPKTNTSGIKGVIWDRERKKWRAQLRTGNKMMVIGRFDDKALAAEAYKQAAKLYFGEFANVGH